MSRFRFRPIVLALATTLVLAACQSSEERAEGHYQSALTLIAEGDVDRALVELRNVFDLDGTHKEARRLYAETQAGRGQVAEAYGQFLRLAEQYPEDLDARIALAELAIDRQEWEEVRRHGAVAREMDPEALRVRAIAVNIAYADALEARDAPARREAARTAEAMIAELPEDLQLRRILVDNALRENDGDEALAQIEAALAFAPDVRNLYDTRVNLLAQMQRIDEIEPVLLDMIDRFPGDPDIVGSLVRLYISKDDLETAETFLRDRADSSAAETATLRRIDLVRFLLELRGPDAALAELDGVIDGAAVPDDDLRSLRAQIRFNGGDRTAAVTEMESLLATAEPSLSTDTNKIVLARMLERMGNRVGAQRLVAEVLESDSTQVDALKLEAGWRITGDDPDGAISLLRTALDAAPEDAEALTLMAQAHSRNGNRDLARDMLALAVEASGNGATEARRYVALLLEEDRLSPAEEVLINALRVAPADVGLLVDLANIYVRGQNWPRVRQIEAQLRRLDTDGANRAADGLQATRLASQGQTDEAVAFLEDLASESGEDAALHSAVIRARILAGDPEGAAEYAAEVAAAAPDNATLALIEATTLSATGRVAEAGAKYRVVLDLDDQLEGAWIGLVRSEFDEGNTDGARQALQDGLAARPDAINLLWAQASFLERDGDPEGALAVYETLYERAPNSAVVANNLASLLSVLRSEDPEAVERAYTVARRLRGTEQPAFQDTYGWISYLRGDHVTALEYLEPAAEGLPQDALVQYHLAAALEAIGRRDAALEQYRHALEIAGDDPRPQFDLARTQVTALESAADGTATPDGG